MAAIYSGTATGSGIIRYSNATADSAWTDTAWSSTAATSTATTSTLSFDLEKFMYEPMNDRTLYQINDTVNRHVTAGAASGIYTLNNRGLTVDSGTGTARGGNWITDYNYEPYNNTVSIKINANMSQEEIEKQEKEHQRQLKMNKIKSNLLIRVKSRGTPHKYIPENEQIAIDTLREYITEAEFRKYLQFGFVCVDGQTGKTYQIFRNGSHTKVWKNGKVIDEICVHIKDRQVPPTDSVIAFRTMIQTSEEDFYKMGNVYKMEKAA